MKHKYARSLCFLFFICFCSLAIAEEHECLEPYFYRVRVDSHFFSIDFEMESDWYTFGEIKKASFGFRAGYYLYNPEGKYRGYAFSRFFCLGAFFNWAAQMDIYDEEGKKIGSFEGEKTKEELIRFQLMNEEEEVIAFAYVDATGTGVSLVEPDQENYTIAIFSRDLSVGTQDIWEAHVYDPLAVDPRIMKLFSAFIADHYR